MNAHHGNWNLPCDWHIAPTAARVRVRVKRRPRTVVEDSQAAVLHLSNSNFCPVQGNHLYLYDAAQAVLAKGLTRRGFLTAMAIGGATLEVAPAQSILQSPRVSGGAAAPEFSFARTS
jgi:hypothetical protein